MTVGAGMDPLAKPHTTKSEPSSPGVWRGVGSGHSEGPAGMPGLGAPGRREAGASPPSALLPGLVYLATKDTCIPLCAKSRRMSRMRRGVISAASLVQEEMQAAGHMYRVAFVTVTYRPGETWNPGDIRSLVKHYRQWGQRRSAKLRIIWVAELHSGFGANRGQVHYHLVIFVPRGVTPPMPDKQGWWQKGTSNCKWAYRPVGYLAKYASKGLRGHSLPVGARLWGVSGLGSNVRTKLVFALAPKWLQQFCQPGEVVKRLPHGWWRNCTTGWEYRTPWDFDWGPHGPVARWRGWTEADVAYLP